MVYIAYTYLFLVNSPVISFSMEGLSTTKARKQIVTAHITWKSMILKDLYQDLSEDSPS